MCMLNQPSSPPKPITEVWRPELVALPPLTFGRRCAALSARICKVTDLCPPAPHDHGPGELPKARTCSDRLQPSWRRGCGSAPGDPSVFAHRRDRQDRAVRSLVRRTVIPAYGIIWVHRGQPDRKAIRAALDGLAEGRMVGLAPEGRQSVIGGLEEGNDGAAFLALKSGAPIVPVAMTGTENSNVYGHLKRLKRAPVTLSVGKPFFLQEQPNRQEMIRQGTRQIMERLASLLPEAYRGTYKSVSKPRHGLYTLESSQAGGVQVWEFGAIMTSYAIPANVADQSCILKSHTTCRMAGMAWAWQACSGLLFLTGGNIISNGTRAQPGFWLRLLLLFPLPRYFSAWNFQAVPDCRCRVCRKSRLVRR